MDELLKIFLSWQFMIFCLGLAGMGFVLRKLIEYVILDNPHIPASKQSTIWRGLILPIAPVISGALAGYLAKGYPYPEGLSVSEYGRVSFGLVAGLLSGLVYRVITEILKAKITQANIPQPITQTVETTIGPDGGITQNIGMNPVIPNIPNPQLFNTGVDSETPVITVSSNIPATVTSSTPLDEKNTKL